jgi:hypothetical protein
VAPDEQSRARRLAENEAFFRDANELFERDAQRGRAPWRFICECSSAGCLERVTLTPTEYEHARSNGAWFIVLPKHEDLTVETVIERHVDFSIVEKHGTAGRVAREEDPR